MSTRPCTREPNAQERSLAGRICFDFGLRRLTPDSRSILGNKLIRQFAVQVQQLDGLTAMMEELQRIGFLIQS